MPTVKNNLVCLMSKVQTWSIRLQLSERWREREPGREGEGKERGTREWGRRRASGWEEGVWKGGRARNGYGERQSEADKGNNLWYIIIWIGWPMQLSNVTARVHALPDMAMQVCGTNTCIEKQCSISSVDSCPQLLHHIKQGLAYCASSQLFCFMLAVIVSL